MIAKTVVLIRHGETDWNAERRWQGHSDVPLNANGLAQAEALASQLKSVGVEEVVTSDLARALETGRIVSQHLGVPFHSSAEIRELNLGLVEGRFADEVLSLLGQEVIDEWSSIRPEKRSFKFPGGETKEEGLKRALGFMETFLGQSRSQTLAFVMHGALMRTLLHSMFPQVQEPIRIPNTKFFTLRFNPLTREWSALGELLQIVTEQEEASLEQVV